ncbi:LLM class flavin-dependent oxidoreductase [Nocardia bovistercoris]|uniref:LLM class flavin-dependent oxidoreductase n=1 Tax=Nocardia bovistercoris TaxID=2785916 RepID=A0A931N4N1_9NOCA|nr:LLM class flavin-dependent oxidoreductase [Nocardia bovistercoris]MBH0778882.1 LLM class flavin-dependent oxidoreductase [Nocardia bovistercoris]
MRARPASSRVDFGLFLIPEADNYHELTELVTYADTAGLDLVGIQDHPYQRRFFDTWTLLTALAVRTSRLRWFPDVANLPLRNPAVLAKAVASLDIITGGRVHLGLGAGAFHDAIVAMGGPRHEGRDAVLALGEAMAVIRAMWSDERSVRVLGRFHTLDGAHPGPAPSRDPGIWLGAKGPRMLALTGYAADGWLPSSGWAPPEFLTEANKRIDEAAATAGRDPSAVRRIYNVSGAITDEGVDRGFLEGPASRWVDELTALHHDQRVDGFVFWPMEGEPFDQIRRYSEQVVPAVRAAVTA